MTDRVPERRFLTAALKELLETETTRPVGVSFPPRKAGSGAIKTDGDVADFPYIIIYPGGGSLFDGAPFCSPESDVAFEYQIKIAGMRDDQVDALADKVRRIILGRDASGYIHDLSYADHVVMLRSPVGPPGKLEREGQSYCVDDSYAISVTSQI